MIDQEYRPFPNAERRNFLQSHCEIPFFARALELQRCRAVLEIGCGRGVALPMFYRLLSPSRLVGVDVDHLLLMEAKRRVERSGIAVQLLQADVRSLPFPAASFDLVVDFGTCFHISNAAAAVQEIARVLVDGGIFASETKVSQILAHPIRTRGRHLRLEAAPQFTRRRNAVLWSSFVRAMRTEERQHGV